MSRPTQRLLAVLEMLQAEHSLSGAEMARRLGIDQRTLRRHIERLEEMGVPITAARGRGGGYALISGFKLPPMMFTDGEAIALSVGLRVARALRLAHATPAVASAQAKLERVLPPRLKARVRAIDAAVAIDLGPRGVPGDEAGLAALSAAAHACELVRLRYRSANGQTTVRTFEPYAIAFEGGCWYAVGWCRLRRGLRSFRIDRIEAIEPLTEGFEPPVEFDALRHLRESVASIPRAHAIEVLLEADLARAHREVSPTFGVLEPIAGRVRLRGQADDLAWFARELSRLPFDFVVLKPARLRTVLARHAGRLARLARRTASPPGGRGKRAPSPEHAARTRRPGRA